MIPLNLYAFEVYNEVWLKIFIDKIEILDNNYKFLTNHKRIYKKIKSTNWKDWLKVLELKISALEYTDFYQELPEIWKIYFKSKDYIEKRKIVSTLSEILTSCKSQH